MIEKHFRFYEGILHEDNLFSFQVILAASRVMVVKDKFYIRLMRRGSIMTAKSNVESSWGYFVCLREMTKYISGVDYKPEVRRCINHVLMTTQREALLPVQGMKKEAVLQELRQGISEEEKLTYEIAVLNGEWMRQQRRLWVRIVNRLRG